MVTGRIIQGIMFMIASSLLLAINYERGCTLGMLAGGLFILGNLLGLTLFMTKEIRRNQNEQDNIRCGMCKI